jgi:hypothetical protein
VTVQIIAKVDTSGLKFPPKEVILQAVGNNLLAWIDENFEKGGIERKWKVISPLTVATRRHGGNRPLQDSGDLRRSFYIRLLGNSVKVGSDSQIAEWMHFGTKGPYPIHSSDGVKSLAAPLRSGGWKFFGPLVMHPGITARPLLPSQARADRIASETAAAVIKKSMSGSSSGTIPSVFQSNRSPQVFRSNRSR